MPILIMNVILVVTLYLMISEKIPIGLIGVGLMVILPLTGLMTPEDAVIGIAHPAVVTVAAMFVVSQGMVRTGAVKFIGEKIIQFSKGNIYISLALILITVAVSSAFINNTPIVILFIPVVMRMCCEFGYSPSQFLIPVSYASIFGGTCTLIGTSTNIILSDLSASKGFGAISMFELAPIGVPIAVIGILILIFLSIKMMPPLKNPICQLNDSEHRRYIAEIKIPSGSRFIKREASKAFRSKYPGIEVIELIRHSHIYHPSRDDVYITANDLILIKGSLNDLVAILSHEKVELPKSEKGISFGVNKDETLVVELIIVPQSELVGQTLLETRLVDDPEIHVIAIKRNNLHFTEKQIYDVTLKNGDMILVWCKSEKLKSMRVDTDFIIAEDVYEEIIHKQKSWFSVGIFSAMILGATTGLADIMVCSLCAALLMLLSGCLQMRDAYKALQADVLLLIAGTIALGAAMEQTGTSKLYAEAFLSLLNGASPALILGGIILLTSLSTQLLSNNATAVLLFPVAVSTALSLGVDPKPFIVGICFGASASFATPIGYQTNLLVYGPGGYRFSDYLKLGIPFNFLIIIAGSIFIPMIWPF